MAEGIFKKLIEEAQLEYLIETDSAGTAAYHTGDLPDLRMRQTAKNKGIELTHRARKVRESDLVNFHYILAMDQYNLTDLTHPQFASSAEIYLMRKFDPHFPDTDVPDPYYGSPEEFDEVYEILERSCRGLLEYINANRLY
jgi:protein-tyrosine phosphatase